MNGCLLLVLKFLIPITPGFEKLSSQNHSLRFLIHITIENKFRDLPTTGVKICILNSDDGTEVACKITDTETVSFHLDADRNYRISVSADGYKSQIETISTVGVVDDLFRKINLVEAAVRLKLLILIWPDNSELLGSTVSVNDMSDISSQQILAINEIIKSNESGNDFLFGLLPDKEYQIVVAAKGYQTFTEHITTTEKTKILDKKIHLKPVSVQEYETIKSESLDIMPVEFYFDHDSPKGNIFETPAKTEFSDLTKLYLLKKEKYRKRAVNELQEGDKGKVVVDQFFNDKIRDWKIRLDLFLSKILFILERGETLEIYIKGYASSVGDIEYNKFLCQRRIDVISGEISLYRNGLLSNYRASGKLIIDEIPVGSEGVTDAKNAIYNIEAASKRRVELMVKR